MNNLKQLAQRWCGPKLSDKGTSHSYIGVYDKLFEPYVEKPITLVEVGVKSGASIVMWSELFNVAGSRIIGIDLRVDFMDYQVPEVRQRANIELFEGSATDEAFMERFNNVDIFIDDGSHLLADQAKTLQIMRSKINPGGIYVIEDVKLSDPAVRSVLQGGELLDLQHERPNDPDNVLYVVRF